MQFDTGRRLRTQKLQKLNVWFALLCDSHFQEDHKSQPSTRECRSNTNIPSMWPCLLCFPDLRYCCCVCVCVCPCVWECLFCLPLSIAVSCPFLSQLEKGTTPLRPWPSVCVCVAFRSLGILGSYCSLCSSAIATQHQIHIPLHIICIWSPIKAIICIT